MLIQNAAKMVDASKQTKRIMNIPRRTPAADISLNDSLISMTSLDSDRDPEWTPDDEIEDMDYDHEINESDTHVPEPNEATERKCIVFETCLDELLLKDM